MDLYVRKYLIELARKRTNPLVTYQKLSDDCFLDLNMSDSEYARAEIGRILGEVSEFEHSNNRPLLSALVVRSGDKMEGDGFYKLAEKLGFGDWRKLKREGIFQSLQINECVSFWSDESNYLKYK